MSAFTVDLDTGELLFDDNVPPYFTQPELINSNLDLLIDGYGVYSLLTGNVFVEGSGFSQPSRILSAVGTLTLIDGTVIVLTGDDIVSCQTSFDVGQEVPIGATPSTTIKLVLANDDRRWDYGGAEIGTKTLDGAIIYIEMSAYSAISDDDFIVTPSFSDWELSLTGDGEEDLFSIVDGELVYTGDNNYLIEDGSLVTIDELYLWGYQYLPLGYFVVDAIDNQQHLPVVTLMGCDYMGNYMMHPYIDSNTYPATYQAIVEDACDQAGVTLMPADTVIVAADELEFMTYDIMLLVAWIDKEIGLVWEHTTTHALKRLIRLDPNDDGITFIWKSIVVGEIRTGAIPFGSSTIAVAPVMPTGKIVTCRDIVGWIAMLAGANAIINLDGELEVRALDDNGELISPSRYITLTYNSDFASTNYTIRLYEYGAPPSTAPLEKSYSLNGDVPYYIIDIRDNPYLFYESASNQSILDDRINLVALWIMDRHSARIEWAGSDTIKPLDTMLVEMLNGVEIKIAATQHYVKFDTGLIMESGCDLSTVTMANSLTAYK